MYSGRAAPVLPHYVCAAMPNEFDDRMCEARSKIVQLESLAPDTRAFMPQLSVLLDGGDYGQGVRPGEYGQGV